MYVLIYIAYLNYCPSRNRNWRPAWFPNQKGGETILLNNKAGNRNALVIGYVFNKVKKVLEYIHFTHLAL